MVPDEDGGDEVNDVVGDEACHVDEDVREDEDGVVASSALRM